MNYKLPYFLSRFIDYFKKDEVIKEKVLNNESFTSDEIIEDPDLKKCDICFKKTKSYATGHNGEIYCMECHNKIMEK